MTCINCGRRLFHSERELCHPCGKAIAMDKNKRDYDEWCRLRARVTGQEPATRRQP